MWGLQIFVDLIQMKPSLLGSFSTSKAGDDITREQGRFKSLFMISMAILSDYSSLKAQSVDEDTDDLEPMDPSIFLGIDDDDDLEEEEGDDLFEEEEEDIPGIEDEEEY